MALKKPKMLKYPRKPKAGASLTVKENYLNKIKDIDKENARRVSEYNSTKSKLKTIATKIAKVSKPTPKFK